MGILSGTLNDQATYWRFSGVDEFGDSKFDPPIIIYVRWEDERRLISDSDGQERSTKSEIWYDMEEDISYNSYLALGDKTATADPRNLIDAYNVKETSSIGDVSGREKVKSVIV